MQVTLRRNDNLFLHELHYKPHSLVYVAIVLNCFQTSVYC